MVGVPTQFVRFAGCNLKCPSWPCDSQFAIDPRLYRKEMVIVTVEDLVNGTDEMREATGAKNVCLTGGEPALQKKQELDRYIGVLNQKGYTVEMFSNGTLHYTSTMLQDCHIVMDWKLPGSGEETHDTTRMQNYRQMSIFGYRHTIKFTCADMLDLEAAKDVYERNRMQDWDGLIYVGPVWDIKFPTRMIVEYVLKNKLSWVLNLQTHKFIWAPDARRT